MEGDESSEWKIIKTRKSSCWNTSKWQAVVNRDCVDTLLRSARKMNAFRSELKELGTISKVLKLDCNAWIFRKGEHQCVCMFAELIRGWSIVHPIMDSVPMLIVRCWDLSKPFKLGSHINLMVRRIRATYRVHMQFRVLLSSIVCEFMMHWTGIFM